jgi:glycosyltransferase involved in cell wall biosynthesis
MSSRRPVVASVMIVADSRDEVYGGERSGIMMLQRLQRLRPHVITNGRHALRELLDEAGIDHTVVDLASVRYTFRAGADQLLRKLVALVADWLVLRRAVSASSASLVHLNDLSPSGQLGLPAAKLARLPVIVHVRTEIALRPVHRWVLRNADASVTVSRNVLERHLSALDGRRGDTTIRTRSHALPNGIDVGVDALPDGDERARARAELGVDDDDFVVVSVGSFEERKRQLHVIENVVPRVLERVPAARFFFAGGSKGRDDCYAQKCRAAAELVAADRITLLGYRPDLRSMYAAADVAILASLLEGLPRTLLEAMARGLPVVAAASPGATELLANLPAGRLVDPDDDGAAMASELVFLAQLPVPELRALGRRSRARVEQSYDIRHVAARFEDLCERVLGR